MAFAWPASATKIVPSGVAAMPNGSEKRAWSAIALTVARQLPSSVGTRGGPPDGCSCSHT